MSRMPRPLRNILLLTATLLFGAPGMGQGLPTATLLGRVSNEDTPLPGVVVTATSPQLQGSRTATTGASGDYVLANLPPGDYTLTFGLSGFQSASRNVKLSAAQQSVLSIALSVQGRSEDVSVIGRSEAISQSAQSSTTYTGELLDKLPTARTLLSAVLLSPGVNQNGPAGAVTISGAQSFENLYMVNGVTVSENLRGTPFDLFIEDAIQETTTSTAGISAEYGRFTGGVVNAITKSGGNVFSGSARVTLNNDAWSALSPAREDRVQSLVPTYEVTLGGPILKDRLWFFGAGRKQDTKGSAQTSFTNISYQNERDQTRYEGKLTLTPFSNHTFTGSYIGIKDEIRNEVQPAVYYDLASLDSPSEPQSLVALNYNGVLSSTFFAEAQYSRRKFSFENAGGVFTDIIKGTPIVDSTNGAFYNSPLFCGVCDPESRDNQTALAKGNWFVSTRSLGSHNVVFGYEYFDNQRKANNYQSGSNYIFGSTGVVRRGTDVFPVFDSSSYLIYWPIDQLSQGSHLKTHGVFVNDSWRISDRLSFNLGVRWDKNAARDADGTVRSNDSALSPRLAATYDPAGRGSFKITASYAKYLAAINETQVGAAARGGTPSILYWYYDGPGATPINTDPAAPLVPTAQALQQVFNWFFGQGCPNLGTCRVPLGGASVPGTNLQLRGSLSSPNAKEYVIGFSGAVGPRGTYRMDFVRREYGDFYAQHLDRTTGVVFDSFGNPYDLKLIENTSDLERKYTALHAQAAYRFGSRLNVGANWTWSHTIGNFNGEDVTHGPLPATSNFYPEYRDLSWNNPRGDLGTDQRHRVRAFAVLEMPVPKRFGALSVSAIQSLDSGVPYGAVGPVNSSRYVTNPGYITPPTSVNYFFTPRDAFHTETIHRTDLAISYSINFGPAEVFFQPQVLNVFNNHGVLAVDQTVNTAFTRASLARFNPFTQQPVQGVNWSLGSTFGQPRGVQDYQAPRTVRLTAGLRF